IEVNGGYALVASGTVSLVGIDGVTLAGTVTARVNTTGLEIDHTIEITGSGSPGVRVHFDTIDRVTELVAVGATLGIGGQSLQGDFAFDKTAGGDLVVAASNVELALGSAVSVTGASGV